MPANIHGLKHSLLFHRWLWLRSRWFPPLWLLWFAFDSLRSASWLGHDKVNRPADLCPLLGTHVFLLVWHWTCWYSPCPKPGRVSVFLFPPRRRLSSRRSERTEGDRERKPCLLTSLSGRGGLGYGGGKDGQKTVGATYTRASRLLYLTGGETKPAGFVGAHCNNCGTAKTTVIVQRLRGDVARRKASYGLAINPQPPLGQFWPRSLWRS